MHVRTSTISLCNCALPLRNARRLDQIGRQVRHEAGLLADQRTHFDRLGVVVHRSLEYESGVCDHRKRVANLMRSVASALSFWRSASFKPLLSRAFSMKSAAWRAKS